MRKVPRVPTALPSVRKLALAVALLMGVSTGSLARADGEFLQLDYRPGGSSVSGSIVRGPWGLGLGFSEFSGGTAFSVTASYALPLSGLGQGAVLRLGPSMRVDQSGKQDFGARAVLEHWTPTSFGGRFFLADFNTIDNEYQLLGEVTHSASRLSASLSLQGSENYRETSVFLGYGLRDTPIRVRLGYKFQSDSFVAGVAINTF